MANNDNIKRALNSNRFPAMSIKMKAVVGFIIEERYATPSIDQMMVTSDGIIMARVTGDIGYNHIIGSVSDFKRNWDKLIHNPNLGLSAEEVKHLEVLPSVSIRNYGE